jgi:hypothetical protein
MIGIGDAFATDQLPMCIQMYRPPQTTGHDGDINFAVNAYILDGRSVGRDLGDAVQHRHSSNPKNELATINGVILQINTYLPLSHAGVDCCNPSQLQIQIKWGGQINVFQIGP